jgi:hypothetical protein
LKRFEEERECEDLTAKMRFNSGCEAEMTRGKLRFRGSRERRRDFVWVSSEANWEEEASGRLAAEERVSDRESFFL